MIVLKDAVIREILINNRSLPISKRSGLKVDMKEDSPDLNA